VSGGLKGCILTCPDEGATSINIYLHSMAQNTPDKRIFTQPSKSFLVRAIRTGPAIPEESILLSFSAKSVFTDEDGLEHCVNAAVPHPSRARQLRHGHAKLESCVEAVSPHCLDESVGTVGGGTVVLKMVDLARTSDELSTTLAILRDLIRDSWSASEEMERIRELLRSILFFKRELTEPTQMVLICWPRSSGRRWLSCSMYHARRSSCQCSASTSTSRRKSSRSGPTFLKLTFFL
jgi:hypothetical protein